MKNVVKEKYACFLQEASMFHRGYLYYMLHLYWIIYAYNNNMYIYYLFYFYIST